MWYAIPEALRTSLEDFTARDVFNTSYLTDLHASARLAIMIKCNVIGHRVVPLKSPTIRMFRLVQKPETFV